MKNSSQKNTTRKKNTKAADANGRAMVADLKELIATMKAGIPIESKYIVRTIELPDTPGNWSPIQILM